MHEFNIWRRNMSDIMPTTIAVGMHSYNKASFAIVLVRNPSP